MEPLHSEHPASFTTQKDQPLIGILLQEDNEEVVRYFAEEAEADASNAARRINDVLKLAGAWKDLDWDEMEKGLERIRLL